MSCSMDHLVNNGDEIQPEKFSSISSTNILTPIEGSNETFRQRQSDVFSALTSLEAAHREVYKATKEERKAVRKAAWRHTITAPENLAELKERVSVLHFRVLNSIVWCLKFFARTHHLPQHTIFTDSGVE